MRANSIKEVLIRFMVNYDAWINMWNISNIKKMKKILCRHNNCVDNLHYIDAQVTLLCLFKLYNI